MSSTDGDDTFPRTTQCTALQVTSLSDVQETFVTVHGVRVEKRYLANWEKWSRVPVVSLLQAVHLSFGVEPSTTFLGCTPTTPLAERLDLALANIGPGGPLEIVADLYAPLSSWFGLQGHTVRVRLATFGDWVLSNDLQLDAGCPRSTRGLPEASDLALQRQQRTLLLVIGMLARGVAKGKRSAMRDDKIIVNAVVNAALDASEAPDGPLGVKKSTLAAYIRKGLNLLEERY